MIRRTQTAVAVVMLMMHAQSARLTNAAGTAGVVGNGTPASCTSAALDTALTGGGVVTFNCGAAPHTIVINEKAVIGTVTIDGGGLVTLDGNNANRHFFVGPGYALTLKNITLTKGNSTAGGGAIEATGSSVTLDNVRVSDNSAGDHGGAIVAEIDSSVTIRNSTVESNRAPKGGAIWVTDSARLTVLDSLLRNNTSGVAVGNLGGGIYAAGVITVSRSALSGNQALDGGGLFIATGGQARVSDSTIANNSGNYGGGIENSGALTVTNSTIHSNTVSGSGGGVWNLGGVISMTRSTVSANSASEGGGINSYGSHVDLYDVNIIDNTASGDNSGGGGIWHAGGTFFARNVTISGNSATSASGDGGGIHEDSNDNLYFVNATVANNTAGRFGGGIHHVARYGFFINSTFGNNSAGVAGNAIYEGSTGVSGPGRVDLANTVIFGAANNCDGDMFISRGHNINEGTCGSLVHATDQAVMGALLGPFGNNGGGFAMRTFAPLSGSPLIDAGDPAFCTATSALTDQRNAPRMGVCDVGAIEYGVVLARTRLPLVLR